MASPDVHARFADEEYKNWLKVGQALLCLRDGLCSFTGLVSRKLQEEILENCAVGSKSCAQCKAKDVEYVKGKNECWVLKNPCPVHLCDKLLTQIANQHQSMKAKQQVYWSNTNISQWTTRYWEIAKVFMGKGQKTDNCGPESTDASNLLILMKNCKYYKPHITVYKNIEKVITIRNNLMHSSTLQVSDTEMKASLGKMIALLEDPQELKDNPEAKNAIKQIEEIKQMSIDLGGADGSEWRDREENLIREKFHALEERLSDLEEGRDKVQEKEELKAMFKAFLQENKDLQDVLGSDLEKAFQHLDNRVDMLERNLNQLKADASVAKKEGASNTGVTSTESEFNESGRYKETLNYYSQKHKITLDYSKKPDPLRDWWGEVKVDGRVYKSEKTFKTASMAQQSAAYQALKGLGYYGKSTSSDELSPVSEVTDKARLSSSKPGTSKSLVNTCPPVSTVSNKTQPSSSQPSASRILVYNCGRQETPKQKELNELLCTMGFEKCTVDIPPVSQGQKVKAILKVKVTCCAGLEESVPGKKTAKQQVASIVLELLNLTVTNPAKTVEQLHSHCGKMSLKQAKYYICEDVNNHQHFWAYAAVESLNDVTREIQVLGNESETESERIDSAAEAMIKVLEGVELTEFVRPKVKPVNSVISNPPQAVASVSSSVSAKPSPQKSATTENDQCHNYVSRLYEYCQKKHQPVPMITAEERTSDKGKEFRGRIRSYSLRVTLECDSTLKKKEAEKKVACHALSTAFSLNVDFNAAKNQLQENCVKFSTSNIPSYNVEGGKAEVTFQFPLEGKEWFADKRSAKAEVAKQMLSVLEKNT